MNTIIRETKIYAFRSPFSDSLELGVVKLHGPTHAIKKTVATLKWSASEEGAPPPPLIGLTNTQAQFLMDQLWHCGLRPSEGTGSAGAMAATEKHLEDMRQLTQRLLNEVCTVPAGKNPNV